jgi:hypothetical protein
VVPTGLTGFGLNVNTRLLRGIVVVVGADVVVDVDVVVTDVVVELDEPADVVVELDEPADVVVELDVAADVVVELDVPDDVVVVEGATDVVLVDWPVVVAGVGMDETTIENVSGLAPPQSSTWAPGVQFTLPVETVPA